MLHFHGKFTTKHGVRGRIENACTFLLPLMPAGIKTGKQCQVPKSMPHEHVLYVRPILCAQSLQPFLGPGSRCGDESWPFLFPYMHGDLFLPMNLLSTTGSWDSEIVAWKRRWLGSCDGEPPLKKVIPGRFGQWKRMYTVHQREFKMKP